VRLNGKVGIVTGASSGIGRAIALLFARQGAKITVADVNREGGEETVSLLGQYGNQAIFYRTDISNSGQVESMVTATVEQFERLDILVNNAAHMKDWKPVLETTEEEWDRSIEVSLKGAFLCSKFAIPEMMKAGGGSIVNISSVGGLVGFASYAAYCSAKGGLIQLTKSLAIDYGLSNIRANAVCPGAIETGISPKGTDDKLYQYQIDMSVLGRTGRPEEVANAALFLASEESSFVTGTTLTVDGGWTVR
jgi:NAD(P)-dependent dehydrogenase (short-subunit alcohol dehydrogenase family)